MRRQMMISGLLLVYLVGSYLEFLSRTVFEHSLDALVRTISELHLQITSVRLVDARRELNFSFDFKTLKKKLKIKNYLSRLKDRKFVLLLSKWKKTILAD